MCFFEFRDSYVLCIYVMNISCTFCISVSWVWYILSAIGWICILPTPDTFQVFFPRPPWYFPPKGLSVPSATLALWQLTRELNLGTGKLLQSAPEISIFFWYLLSIASLRRLIAVKSKVYALRMGICQLWWSKSTISSLKLPVWIAASTVSATVQSTWSCLQ